MPQDFSLGHFTQHRPCIDDPKDLRIVGDVPGKLISARICCPFPKNRGIPRGFRGSFDSPWVFLETAHLLEVGRFRWRLIAGAVR